MNMLKKEPECSGVYDVIVAGAGPAGLCAAMSAAREGAKVLLIDRFGTVGGNLTVGFVGPVMGLVQKGTMADEINELAQNKEYSVQHDVEQLKINLIEWLDHENITVLLNSPMVDVEMEGDKITGIIVGTPNGLKLFRASVIIDSTGDGTAAYLAGAEYKMGRDEDGLTQPVSILFTIENIEPGKSIKCTHEEDDTALPQGNFLELCKEANRNGELPEEVNIVRLYPSFSEGVQMVNATQLNKVDGLSGTEAYQAQLNLRRQMGRIVEFLKKTVPGYENIRIKSSASGISVRETRRIIGEYILTGEDVVSGRKFDDAVVHEVNFAIDIHNPDGAGQAESDKCPVWGDFYDIPYRCFVPKKIDNLLVGGRCISGDHRAHASYRVMNICMVMGEAVGAAAALCVKEGVTPRKLDVKKLQKLLISRGVDL